MTSLAYLEQILPAHRYLDCVDPAQRDDPDCVALRQAWAMEIGVRIKMVVAAGAITTKGMAMVVEAEAAAEVEEVEEATEEETSGRFKAGMAAKTCSRHLAAKAARTTIMCTTRCKA